MISMQPNVYRSERPNAASIGTRAYQLALFVVFESGLQMLADNPTLYYRNEDCTRFITQVPVTWDETVALEAKIRKEKQPKKKFEMVQMLNAMKDERERGK
jgi:alpha-glucosidase